MPRWRSPRSADGTGVRRRADRACGRGSAPVDDGGERCRPDGAACLLVLVGSWAGAAAYPALVLAAVVIGRGECFPHLGSRRSWRTRRRGTARAVHGRGRPVVDRAAARTHDWTPALGAIASGCGRNLQRRDLSRSGRDVDARQATAGASDAAAHVEHAALIALARDGHAVPRRRCWIPLVASGQRCPSVPVSRRAVQSPRPIGQQTHPVFRMGN